MPCLGAVPHLQALANELSKDSVQFVMATDEKPQVVRKFLERRKLPGWVVADTDKSVFNAYGIRSRPHAVIVDREGRVAMRCLSSALTAEMLRKIGRGEWKAPAKKKTPSTPKAPRYPASIAGFDPLATPFIEAGRVNMRTLPYQTIIRRTMDPQVTALAGTTQKGGGSGITLIAQTPRRLAGYVDGIAMTRVVDEAKLGNDRWDFIIARPRTPLAKAKVEAGSEFDRAFNVKRVRSRVMRSVLVATGREAKLTPTKSVDRQNDPTAISFLPIITVLRRYEVLSDTIVVCEIPSAESLCIDTFGIDLHTVDAASLKAWLEKHGVRFESAQREIEVLRLLPKL